MNKTTITIGGYSFLFDEVRQMLTTANGENVPADIRQISSGEYSVIVGGHSFHLFLSGPGKSTTSTVNNFIFPIERETLRDRLSKKLSKDSDAASNIVTVRAPMPGMITKVIKQEGISVVSGEGILIMEAMKMENEIKASKHGILKKIFVKEKQTVEKNDNLFTIE